MDNDFKNAKKICIDCGLQYMYSRSTPESVTWKEDTWSSDNLEMEKAQIVLQKIIYK